MAKKSFGKPGRKAAKPARAAAPAKTRKPRAAKK